MYCHISTLFTKINVEGIYFYYKFRADHIVAELKLHKKDSNIN